VPIERITLKLPANFDPGRHLRALEKLVADKYGDKFELESIDPIAGTAFATRHVAVTEVNAGEQTEDRFEVRLPMGTKPSDGEKIAARLEDQHPGYVLAAFEPYLGRALLARLTPAEQRCRGALAVAFGVPPWDVQVAGRKDGGFDVVLPPVYVPSKHDARLNEVATLVVGQEGWHVETDPKALTASILPGEPPSFPAVLPYPFKKTVARDDWSHVPIGQVLGRTGGEAGPELVTDTTVVPHGLVSGLTGAGKLLRLDTRVPVPLSERFPDGWATVGTLEIGDSVYSADGSLTKIVGFSDQVVEDEYEVHFDTGQDVRCGPSHLWLASHHVSRVGYTPSGRRKTSRGIERIAEKDGRLRALAHATEPGAFATIRSIAATADMDPASVWKVLLARGIPSESVKCDVGGRQTVNRYLSSEAFLAMREHASSDWDMQVPSMNQISESWLTAREIFALCGVGDPTRDQLRQLRSLMQRWLVTKKTVLEDISSTKRVLAFPLGEALLALAEASTAGVKEKMPLESVVSTAEMFNTQLYEGNRSNWAVKLPVAIAGVETDLPIPPYVLGAWLGDGTSRNGEFTSGCSDACTDEFGLTDSEHLLGELEVYSSHTLREPTKIGTVGLRVQLREAGVLNNKHIPPIYLRASFDQRLALLQGLMDTDGTVSTRGTCELTLSDERLIYNALELIRSLGIKATISSGQSAITEKDPGHPGRRRRRVVGTRWRVHFTTTLPVFRLPRKLARMNLKTRETTRWLYITKIVKSSPQRMRCLRVAHPSHLVLVEDFIPTHNSVLLTVLATGALARGWELCIVDAVKGGVDFTAFQQFVRSSGWGDDLSSACCVLQLVYDEGQRRKKLIQQAGVQKWTQLPVSAGLRPVLVIVDELTSLVAPEPTPKGVAKDNPLVVEVAERNLLKATILNTIGKIARELRFTGISLVVGTQVASTSTGIPTELRANLGMKVLLGGKPTDNNRRLALNDPDAVPRVPLNIVDDATGAARGVGVFEIEGRPSGVVKVLFANPAECATYLRALGVPTTDRPRPTPAEIARHTPSLEAGTGIEDPARAGDRSPSGNRPEPTRDPETGEVLHGFAKANEQRRRLDAAGRQRPDPRPGAQELA
jgi:replicative DNA helicase